MTAKTRKWLLAFAALGLGASAWSSYVHHTLLTQPAGYTTFCDVSSTVSCTQAYLSQYGSLWGIPVALLGLVFFAVVFLLVWVGGRVTVQSRDNVPAYVFALSTVGLAFVMYLAWASFFRLNAVCLLCVATYVAVVGLFVISGRASQLPMSALPGRASKDAGALLKSPLALLLAALLSLGAISLFALFPRETTTLAAQTPPHQPLTDQQRFELMKWLEVQPRVDVPVSTDGAKVLVLKFNDYQCPACRQAYVDYKPLVDKYEATGDVRFLVKHYPLEPECNPSVPGGTHRAACESAAAVVMAEEKGTADRLENWLFANLATLTTESVRKAASDVGGIENFDARYAGALERVRADAALGDKLGVRSTPTFFINGLQIPGVLPAAYVEAIIEHELRRAS